MESVNSHPAEGVRIAPFFVLNDDLHEDRLRQMVYECAQAGFDSIILHPRPGLRTPYLSKAWFTAIAFCIQEARQRKLKVWLYDEYPWPSGAAGGRVIQKNADFSEKHLTIQRYHLKGGAKVRQVLGNIPVLEAFLVPLGADQKIRWPQAQTVTSAIGMRNTTWITREWDSRYYYPPDYVQRYECRRAMQYLPEQVFEETIPEGDWTLITFTITVGSDFLEPFGHYVDLSNREATETFLEETHNRYRQHFRDLFGSEILGIFTDEPKYRDALPWSNTIAHAWEDYQRDPRALLALLPDSDASELLKSYRQVTTDLYARNWVAPIRDWCRNEKLNLIGHISPEEDLWGESRSAGSILQHLRQFSVPGCDLIIPAVGDRAHPVLNLTPSLAASAAAQAGASQALCEVFGCSNYSLDMQTVKRVSDWLMLFGINFIVPHACFYSLAGPRRFDAPPTFLSPSTLQPFLTHWSTHIRKTAKTLGPRKEVDVAIVRPMRHLFGLSSRQQAEASRLFAQAIGIAQHLLEQGISFHWLDDSDLADARFFEEGLRVGKATYPKLIVWQELLPLPLSDQLHQSKLPLISPEQAMTLRGPLDCRDGDVRAVRDHEGRWFCVNLSAKPRSFSLAGQKARLEGYESQWLDAIPTPSIVTHRESLGNDWQIRPLKENTFRLMNWTCNGLPRTTGPAYHTLVSDSHAAPTVYGPVPEGALLANASQLIYETAFLWEGATQRLSLHLEEGTIEGDWRIFLNDIPLSDWQPGAGFFKGCTHSLTSYLQPGKNHLRIEVTASDARHGLWLDPVLNGYFTIDTSGTLHGYKEAKPARKSDWTQAGYPHYSGSMDFEQSFHWEESEDAGEAWLVFTHPPAGTVEVFVNGQKAGLLLWSPWRLRIHDHVRSGFNKLCLRVTNTLHNFLCGESRSSGPLAHAEIQALWTKRPEPHSRYSPHSPAPQEIVA